ncbi:hypothetical protein Q8A67_005639 [Cirrhinus molitorella]|uniref:Ig-like domain-containing protein n=1 Tax=Cirrhinus molitorella TaxID=172907 RepID=A0AA88TTX8_9TELE|nr:hypothetical protein Q8A67_005639 [Cirrhinus molitorella]
MELQRHSRTKRNIIFNHSNFAHTKMTISDLFLYVLLLKGAGAFGATDGVKSISVMEGDSVTLHTDLNEIQKVQMILWTYGLDNTRIAQLNTLDNRISLYAFDGRFRGRLQLDDQTGSLTIMNIKYEHAGLYELQIIRENKVTSKKFSIIVSAHLPVPVISSNCSSSSSYCSLVCSVVNVSHVTLSWYKGNSLLSSISVSDLSISLSLPLEVEYQDKNSYSCVLNNPISNQTQHLDISKLCHTCSASSWTTGYIVLVCVVSAGFCILVVAVILCLIYKKAKRFKPDSANQGSLLSLGRCSLKSVTVDKDEIRPVSEKVGHSVTLNPKIKEIKNDEVIEWKFANSNKNSQTDFFVIAEWDKRNNTEYQYNEDIFKGRLELDHNNGSLTIRNITLHHSGHYKLHITNEEKNISMILFIVDVQVPD